MVKTAIIFVFLLCLVMVKSALAWEVDFSHHKVPPNQRQVSSEPPSDPTAVPKKMENKEIPPPPAKNLDGLVKRSASNFDRQEFVILNTHHGFIPGQVRLKQGLHYRVHVVNVNEDKKNVSFMLDAFNQHYATFYGQIRTFDIDPDKEGVYDFQCPETLSSGKIIVFGPNGMSPVNNSDRMISSEKE